MGENLSHFFSVGEIPTFTDSGFQFSVSISLPYNSEKNKQKKDSLHMYSRVVFSSPAYAYLVLDKGLLAYAIQLQWSMKLCESGYFQPMPNDHQ